MHVLIHKSKGLEFDHVLLPELHKRSISDPNQLMQWLEQPRRDGSIDLLLAPISPYGKNTESIYQYLQLQEKQKLEQESKRLLYVACTRAKKSLHLYFRYDHTNKTQSETIKIPARSNLHSLWSVHKEQWLSGIMPTNEAKTIIQKERQELFRLSDQAISTNQNRKTRPQQRTNDINQLNWHSNTNHASIVGTIIHSELERLSKNPCHEWKIEERDRYWGHQLIEQGIYDEHAIQNHIDKIKTAVRNTTGCPKGRWILSQNHSFCASEHAVSYSDGRLVNHWVIDRLIIENNQIWIIDYKTVHPDKDVDHSEWMIQIMHDHQQQIQRYCEAIEVLYPNHTIRGALYLPLHKNHWIEITGPVIQKTTI